MLKTSAFVVFTKTWGEPTDSDLFHWDDEFEETIRECGKRNTKRGRSSGGISFCSRKKPEYDYEVLSSDSYRILLKINKSLYNEKDDKIICFLYISPNTSRHSHSRTSRLSNIHNWR